MSRSSYGGRIAKDPVADAYNQLNKVSEKRIAGFGSGIPFAVVGTEHFSGNVIGLIPCAKNSGNITQWQMNPRDHALYGSIHFTTESFRIIGRSLADAYWKLVELPGGGLSFGCQSSAISVDKVFAGLCNFGTVVLQISLQILMFAIVQEIVPVWQWYYLFARIQYQH